jgi:hypothetical protein
MILENLLVKPSQFLNNIPATQLTIVSCNASSSLVCFDTVIFSFLCKKTLYPSYYVYMNNAGVVVVNSKVLGLAPRYAALYLCMLFDLGMKIPTLDSAYVTR